jgi:hypothetical protein
MRQDTFLLASRRPLIYTRVVIIGTDVNTFRFACSDQCTTTSHSSIVRRRPEEEKNRSENIKNSDSPGAISLIKGSETHSIQARPNEKFKKCIKPSTDLGRA